jgi:uncharacterized membrane protein
MELLAVILLLVIFFTLVSFKSSVANKFQNLEDELSDLRKLVAKNRKESNAASSLESTSAIKETITPKKDYWESNFKVQEELIKPLSQPEGVAKQNEEAEMLAKKMLSQEQYKSAKPIEIKQVITPPVKEQEPVIEQSFFDRHPDLEKFIGENLISKVGIGILVLAIGFFVKYAIDKNWIGPIARVGIGILCGGILIALAHRLHKSYTAFSSVLVGGGLAVFYFTIALAYHQFHLFGQTMSFIIMVVITIFAVVLSMLYNRQELAIISLVGGFVTPFLVSTGSGNFVTLFSYLLILNAGLLVIAYNRSWRILNMLAFGFTTLLFFLWIIQLGSVTPSATYGYGFVFATAFYILFFAINIANNIKEKRQFIASDFSIILANTALYFTVGLYFLGAMGSGEYKGLFTALMGAFNLIVSWILFRKQQVDRNILYLLIGITVSFISLAAPVQLQGNNITLFWASESVLLYWLYQRAKINIIRLASITVWIVMLVSLLIDWGQFHFNSRIQHLIVFNKGFITTTYAALSSYLLFVLRKKESSETKDWIARWHPGDAFLIVSLVLGFAAGALEINYQFSYYFPGTLIGLQYILLFTYSFITILFLVSRRKQSEGLAPRPTLYLLTACLVIYVFSISENFTFLHLALTESNYSAHIVAHWAAMIELGIIYFIIIGGIRSNYKQSQNALLVTWLLSCWIVVYLSCEVSFAVQSIYYDGSSSLPIIKQAFIKSGLPILWGLCSFAFMWLGMKYKYRPLRIISLSLFSITLIKLFAFDIRNISAGGKIAAFFCLGVLLLIISFMYQKLKKIIIEDVEKPVV